MWLFEERFDKEIWHNEPLKRYEMVDNLIEQQLLIGKTKEETILLLGTPNSTISLEQDVFLYEIGEAPSFMKTKGEQLLVTFENQKVVKVALTYK